MRLAAFPVLALLLGSCASGLEPTVSGYWVPALIVQADRDASEPDGDVHFDADLHTGAGWAARVGHQDDTAGFGFLYMTTRHEDSSTGTGARTHSGYIEFYVPLRPDVEPPFFFAGFAGGAGAAVFDFDDEFDDTGAAAGMIRIEGGFRPVEHVSILLSGGGFLWGYPTETIGYGGFLMLGLGAEF